MISHQPPRRMVQHVKDLVRAGYTVLKPGEGHMSQEVKGIAKVIVEDITKLKQRAQKIGDSMKQNVDGIHASLDVAEEMDNVLTKANAELQGALGMLTNNPPKGERLEDEPPKK